MSCLLRVEMDIGLDYRAALDFGRGGIGARGACGGVLVLESKRNFFRSSPTRVVVSLFATLIPLAASICSAWSYILMSKGWVSYTAVNELHAGAFADFYMWHLIDVIPGLEIWKTLGVEAPVKANDVAARIPILMCHICVALPVFAFIKKWYDTAKATKTGKGNLVKTNA